MKELRACGMLTLLTLGTCCIGYTLVLLGVGKMISPSGVSGSIIENQEGKAIGSKLIAQEFKSPWYLYSRPSAAGYNGAASSGSNLGANNSKLRHRVKDTIEQFYSDIKTPIPADLVTASGSGLDPHITLEGAKIQAERIAQNRKVTPRKIIDVLDEQSFRPLSGLAGEALVNVLEVNIELDRKFPVPKDVQEAWAK